ncbi:lipoprotein-anchoring transpeptidase ErfK/SrfK [Murinocardiopsis flavida]|uniref:Lipoprotein-anchoring transpeptidase ErfK/SrfK n=1 Tax=Murinocardiopsis flavida TaxID=645275 RepID=A0A2P8CPL1_9ACTN|nr:Ig-like domain-containing protein [Murinocardiopsis flavida]PSK86906.1 lipoprotein-anchoring transpeptidase ErfK/SrfK [Murinocardiopsis flavida]
MPSKPPRPTSALRIAVLAGAVVLLASACTGGGGGGGTGGGEDAPAAVIAPKDGATEVRPDLPITVKAADGTVKDVEVEVVPPEDAEDGSGEEKKKDNPADEITGSLNKDKTTWTSDWTLTPGAKVTVRADIATGGGAEKVESSFSTLPATEGKRLELESNFPSSGDEVGVGMPVIVNFDLPVENKEKVEAAMNVTSEKPAVGAWNWFDDKTAVFRPKEYWEPNQKVTVDMHLAGVPAAKGVYGLRNYRLAFEVGRSQISTVSNKSHRMVVERDGKEIKDFPISNGDGTKPEFRTTSGTHVTMERHTNYKMDSATIGIPEGSPGAYSLTVAYAVRFSNSGEFAHTSAGNPSLGSDNVSHGCTNMNLQDSKWFYENTLIGDPYIVTGTTRDLEVDNGWGYWQRPWDEWLKESALGEPDTTDKPGSPGSPHGSA